MKRFGIVIFVIVVLAAAGLAVMYAHHEGRICRFRGMLGHERRRGPGGSLGTMFNPEEGFGALRPTKEQQEKLTPIVTKLEDKMLALKVDEVETRVEISEILLKPNADKAALSNKLQEMLKLKGQEQQEMLNTYFEVQNLLTPTQKRAFSHFVVRKLLSHGLDSHERMEGSGH